MDPAMLKKALLDIKGLAREMKGDGLKAKYCPPGEAAAEEMVEEDATADEATAEPPMEGGEGTLEDPEGELDEAAIAKLVEMLSAK